MVQIDLALQFPGGVIGQPLLEPSPIRLNLPRYPTCEGGNPRTKYRDKQWCPFTTDDEDEAEWNQFE